MGETTPKKVWMFGDYSQAEARVVAWAGPVPALKAWFKEGKDVHIEVARRIAKVAQENHVVMPRGLFTSKPWDQYVRGDEERDKSKNTVHGNNYGLGYNKFAMMIGLPTKFAKILQEIYFSLFPEVKTGYQAWIDKQLRETRCITTPSGRKRHFYGRLDEETSRSAYSYYPQSTVGDITTDTLCDLCELFHAWDGPTIYDRLHTPQEIQSWGLDVELQVHDDIGLCIDNDPDVIEWTARRFKKIAERPVIIKGEELVIPLDIKIGPSWGELTEYKLEPQDASPVRGLA